MNPPILWQAEEVLRAVRGSSLHAQTWKAGGVSIDSRTVATGDLFVALQGPTHDGHDHVAAAFTAGAVAAIVARQPSQVPQGVPLVVVEDTLTALQELGRAGRNRAKGKIIAVTGSVGKTSTKEMLHLALGAVGHVYANPGSFNNHWGLPLSLARLPVEADYGVFELGMNHAGELAALSVLARPHIVIITTVEAVHLEFFASVEAIADAKAEIFQGIAENGIAILNRDNPHFARLAAAAKNKGLKKILSFGRDSKADAYTKNVTVTTAGSVVDAMIAGSNIHYSIGAPGQHLVQNSLGALLAAASASGNAAACAAALEHYKPPKGRGVTWPVNLANGRLTVIDESYNASPVSVKAAICVLADMKPAPSGRRILVLGDMRELGKSSPDLHAGLVPAITEAKIDSVFCCGEMMRYLFDALPAPLRGSYAADSSALAPIVAAAVHAGDVVTVKGSNSMKLVAVIDALKALDTAPQKIAS